MVGERLSTSRRRYTTHSLLAVGLLAAPLGAQGRVVERHVFAEPEGRLLAFYAAAMAFTPAGLVPDRTAAALEVTWVPRLDEAQRRPSIDKPEATNLAPFFPRPRGAVRLGSLLLEGSWIPPISVFDAKANVLAASVSTTAWRAGGWHLVPRLWGVTGRVRGTITCAASAMLGRGSALETYYQAVCHGRESDDWFEPRLLGAEALLTRALGGGGVRGYAGAGARLDRTRFDIGVIRQDGSRDQDHPILALRATRPHVMLGAEWRTTGTLATGAELFYAPGSVLTVRVSGRWSPRP